MIIVRLKGGLGNQMFQYAVGRRLALHLGTTLKLDASGYGRSGSRRYALASFSIACQLATDLEVDRRLGRGGWRSQVHRWLTGGKVLRQVAENTFRFDPNILLLQDDVYLDGYWQSESYFEDFRSQIRSDFAFHHTLQGRNAKIAARIASCTAVALHVRRGDYVTDTQTNAWHGTCPPDYYRRCLLRLGELCRDPVFFVFSDDLTWARRNLPLPSDAVFIEGNDERRAVADLHLMSLCRHHIIANSTFSWWGAWLAERPDQIVLAPKRWFRTSDLDDRDLIPARWERVDSLPEGGASKLPEGTA